MLKRIPSFLALSLLLMATSVVAVQPEATAKIDLNSADQEQLQSLPGIGPSLARRIIDFRDKNGPFERIEDLMNVRGIGERKFDQLKDLIKVDAKGKPSSKPSSR